MIRDHVLLPFARDVAAADARLAPRVTPALLAALVATIPDDWFVPDPVFDGDDPPTRQRDAYVAYLSARLEAPRAFVDEAARAAGAARD